ncbi:ATP-binding cassette domain-containing protein [Bradyrhizobium sp. CIAT3101]|uniref:type I secretion system permease/ATPase n=1 Tax=Bradyrhizobium sp. CIAT3101 TaxID=439387 RepID=UPI0024B0417B|nr:ATP-binding cassette domain-containing protein [Bradyrhizobium sp. CIAT3101]WFU82978.1 ATP-binding cassette domain-containing protein [Bradyrhizobium sp. CIAT3101]
MLMPPIRLPILPQIRTPLHAALRSCVGPLGLVFAYSCSYNLLLFAPSIYLLQIYDRVLSSRSGDTLLLLTLIVATTVVVGGVFDALRRAVLGRLGAWLDDRLRPCVLSAGLESAFRSDWTQASGAYRDLTVLRQFVESGACTLLFDALWAPLFLLVLFLIHPLLGLVGACCVALLFALTITGELVTEDVLLRSGAALSRSCGRLQTAAGNIHMIRAMGMFDSAARMIHRDAQHARREHDVALRLGEMVMLATKPVRALSQVLIMGAAAWLVLDHGKSPAIIFASTLMFSRALAPVESAVAGWKSLVAAMSACQRLGALLAAFPAARQQSAEVSPPQAQSGLVVDNVSVRLAGTDHLLLNGVSFSLMPGECLGIIGPSGSGKSLLGQVIAGLSMPTYGRVLLDDTVVSLLREGQSGDRLGYLPQDINLLGDTINDIIARLEDADRRKVVEAAKLVGIHGAIMRLPLGYDTVIHSETAFSRGYRQRLGLARAFFGSPRLVVLDEPNASLDYGGERMLLDAIERMKLAGVILVVVTHRMGLLAATDKIAIMEDGAVAAFGDSEEIFERHLSRPQVTSQIAP